MRHLISLAILFILLISCKSKSIPNADFFEENQAVNLYAFIGEKIEINEINTDRLWKEYDSTTGAIQLPKKAFQWIWRLILNTKF